MTPSPPARGPITTHVLDTAHGVPARGIGVTLEHHLQGVWQPLGHGTTDTDGRLTTLLAPGTPLSPGIYRLTFATGDYLTTTNTSAPPFYPEVQITFQVAAGEAHYHVPLLLSPFGYSTYRGS